MIENNPKVSIYITTCNRLDKLKRAVISVQNQDYSNIEILICDDASTDGTEKFVDSLIFEDARIKYFRNDENKGACATRNIGIFNATGEFITGLDDDDEFTPDRLSFFIDKWDDKYSFICANFENKYQDSMTLNYRLKKEKEFHYSDLLFANEASNQIFTRTERLREIGGFDVSVKRLQDWDTWLRLSHAFGPFIRFPESKYIMHHDHVQSESRVSRSYSFVDALNDMAKRNAKIYGFKERKTLNMIILTVNGNLKLKHFVQWFLLDGNPLKVLRMVYLYSKMKVI
ncbi:glycosyltransferase [Dickeya dadantii]|uniref:glycosyltransferase n=1 Tax=Dickeya dadantii TaxID=204038 RepID=UPI00137240E0|nr:glycosyltransferase [Dickeya dadantii]MCL6404093.1 glycosyltransferase [Dickeya dadantii]NAT76278.1 glycosyl transferase family 2 [Dickeya dadantii]NPE54449.1 glycosyltransferase [Dickeya dadantii]NPE61542.1 glycosyltransferase [Dickeya dadantii]NPE67218.1 glycosyltransferase [Dickeya dadantii]